MEDAFSFSERESEVARLLARALSNREIANQLGISERTVEFHLTNIYRKMGVSSRAEAIVKLRESAGPQSSNLGEFTVDGNGRNGNNRDGLIPPGPLPMPVENHPHRARSWINRLIFQMIAGVIIAVIVICWQAKPTSWEGYVRECEHPEESTVGQILERTSASNVRVHGQFGAAGVMPWPSQAGQVTFKSIYIPKTDKLYLNLRYSKYSSATIPIMIYLDDETTPRNSIVPIDQHSWDVFTWSGPVFLGEVDGGLHSIKFFTEGQQYGVADLDEFVLSIKSP